MDDMIRDRLVFGCKSGKLREGASLTMDKAIWVAQQKKKM
jgi:hypothetical protein